MAVRWQIAFKTLSNHDGLVKVYDSTYSGDAIDLMPAARAFTTTRQASALFQPVMTDSGYLRVIDNGISTQHIEDMHPIGALDRPVEFYIDNVLEWRGYISPESFSVNWEAAPREVALPLVGALSVLDSVDIQENGTDLQPIAKFIKEILTATGFSWSKIILAKQMESVDGYEGFPEFRLSVSRYRFVNYNTAQNIDDPDWTRYVGNSYLEVLKKICAYFGWTASQHGANLILSNSRLDLTDADFESITWSDLGELASDPEAVITPVAETRPELAVGSLDFDGVNHRKSIQNGHKKVTVETNVATVDSIYPQIFFNGKEQAFYEHKQALTGAGGIILNLDLYGRVRFLDPSKENASLFVYSWDDVRNVWVRGNWHKPTGEVFPMTPRADIVEGFTFEKTSLTPAPPDPRNNYKKYLRLCRKLRIDDSGSGSGSGGSTWKTLDSDKELAYISAGESGFFAKGGALCFSCHIRNNFLRDETSTGGDLQVDDEGLTQWGPFGGKLKMSVRIGDKYYDGDGQWGDNEVIFAVETKAVGASSAGGNPTDPTDGIVVDTNNGQYQGAEGYVIPIPEDMIGQIVIVFYPWVDTDGTSVHPDEVNTIYLHELSVRYFNDFITDHPDDIGVRISQLTGRAFKSDLTSSLAMSSLGGEQPPVASNSYLFWDGSPIGPSELFVYCDEDETTLAQPEYWLMDSLCKAYTNPATWLELEVSADDDIQLYSVFTYQGKKYLVTYIDADYSSEHLKIKIASYE